MQSSWSSLAERAAFVAALALLSEPAYAYIDPSTGSVVTATILGILGSITYTFRKYMYRVKDLFSKRVPAADVKRQDAPGES